MKEFPQKQWSSISLDQLIQKSMLMIGLTVILVAVCHPKSARTTDNIAVHAGLDLRSE